MGGLARVVYTAAALALAFMGLTIAFFAVNAGDEELSREAEQMLKPPENPYAAAENLYVALAGFDAPRGVPIIAAGQKTIAAYDRIASLSAKDRKAAHAAAGAERSDRLQVRGGFDCRPAVKSCWSAVENRRTEHASELKANEDLYRRYLQLHAMRGYFDTSKPSMDTPNGYAPAPLKTLFLESVALRIKDARTAPERSVGLADLDRDIRTWRAMLTGHGNIVSKFVAIHHLHADYALLADILGDSRLDLSSHLREIEDMLSRVEPNDWKIAGALDYEFRMIAALFVDIEREQSGPLIESHAPGEKAPWWQSLVPGEWSSYFRGNATRNLAARHMLEVRRVAAADGRDCAAEQARLHRWREEHLTPGVGYFKNPIGKILLSVGSTAYDDYPLRAHDAAGFHRLVKLGFEVRRQNVSDDAIPAFIKRHAWASHPVSEEPFAWDASKRELVMAPLAPVNKERRFRIPVK